MILKITILIFAALLHTAQSLTCLQCNNTPQPRHCTTVTECDNDEICGVENISDEFGDQLYNVGCMKKLKCMQSNNTHHCIECCTSDLCNAKGCGQRGYPQNRGPICYNCPVHTNPKHCHLIDICRLGEVCVFDARREFGDLVYSSRCFDDHACRQGVSHEAALVGRRGVEANIETRSLAEHVCRDCCDKDLCNNICNGSTPAGPCDKKPCIHGICHEENGDFFCVCDQGFIGKQCNVSTNHCLSNPCQHGQCHDSFDDYVCICDQGYTGKQCNASTSHCLSNPCHHGQCYDVTDNYICTCDHGFTGGQCTTSTNHCLSNPCQHGQCHDSFDDYVCTCDQGYTGKQCNASTSHCLSNPCHHGQCYDVTDNYICTCDYGFTGRQCTTSTNHCLSNPCKHGQCHDSFDDYVCTCDQGYTGKQCNASTSLCLSNPCKHGQCYDGQNDFLCICDHGYRGKQCDKPELSLCASNPCEHGNCTNIENGYACLCTNGYVGRNCETPLASDCYDILHRNIANISGVYSVQLSDKVIEVFCDMDTDNGGWTVFQKRFNGSVDFYRNFKDYENGFGNVFGEFWLGLENIQEMTSNGTSELRLDLTAADGSHAYETFQNFTLGVHPNYTLYIDSGSGSAGDSNGLSYNNGYNFYTYDLDNSHNCSEQDRGGWWYYNCAYANLNGEYITPGTVSHYHSGERGMTYRNFQGTMSLKKTTMMFRRVHN